MGKAKREIARRKRVKMLNALRMRDEGLTYDEIGKRIGRDDGTGPLSRERVRQLVVFGTRYRDRQRRQNYIAGKESTATYEFNGRRIKFYRRGPFVTIEG